MAHAEKCPVCGRRGQRPPPELGDRRINKDGITETFVKILGSEAKESEEGARGAEDAAT